ncbi:MAG TPA: hypothetical protein P5191_10650 [Ruminococcus sp.]|nr:hypothetical protein [Ruminococcus sp.]
MDKYKSDQTVYDPKKKKFVPLWRLDIHTITVTHFNPDTLTEEMRTYSADYIRHHIHYCESKYPDYIRRLVNEGKIIQYLDDMKLKVDAAIKSQVARWKQTDSEYKEDLRNGDTEKIIGLENCFTGMAREVIFDCMIYI